MAGAQPHLRWCSQRVISLLPQASLFTDCVVRIQQLREPSAERLSTMRKQAPAASALRARTLPTTRPH
eukprot:6275578-Prymnesium_polylepis.1